MLGLGSEFSSRLFGKTDGGEEKKSKKEESKKKCATKAGVRPLEKKKKGPIGWQRFLFSDMIKKAKTAIKQAPLAGSHAEKMGWYDGRVWGG